MGKLNLEKCISQISIKRNKINKLQKEIDDIKAKIDSHIKSELNKLTIQYFKCDDNIEKAKLEENIKKLMGVTTNESQ